MGVVYTASTFTSACASGRAPSPHVFAVVAHFTVLEERKLAPRRRLHRCPPLLGQRSRILMREDEDHTRHALGGTAFDAQDCAARNGAANHHGMAKAWAIEISRVL